MEKTIIRLQRLDEQTNKMKNYSQQPAQQGGELVKIEEQLESSLGSPADTNNKIKCENCEEQEVENKGDWCDDCNLPERSKIK